MGEQRQRKPWDLGMLQAIADTLTAYLTVQARQGLWPAYSEYLLYDPIVRVARYRGLEVECEVPLPKAAKGPGDNKRVDFRLKRSQSGKRAPVLLLELKYVRKPTLSVAVADDIEKLRDLLRTQPKGSRAYLMVAGRRKRIGPKQLGEFKLSGMPDRLGKPTYTVSFDAAHTRFGVSVFRVTLKAGPQVGRH